MAACGFLNEIPVITCLRHLDRLLNEGSCSVETQMDPAKQFVIKTNDADND